MPPEATTTGPTSPPRSAAAGSRMEAARRRQVRSGAVRCGDSEASLLAKYLVHHLRALSKGRPDFVAINQLGSAGAIVPGKLSDAFHWNAVRGQDRDERGPHLSGYPVLPGLRALRD